MSTRSVWNRGVPLSERCIAMRQPITEVHMRVLSGYKTYIAAVLMVIVGGLYQQGFIDDTTFKSLEAIILGGGLAALRAGVKK